MTATLLRYRSNYSPGRPTAYSRNPPSCVNRKEWSGQGTGFDRGSFGRNTKVLLGWVRSQINVAAYELDNDS